MDSCFPYRSSDTLRVTGADRNASRLYGSQVIHGRSLRLRGLSQDSPDDRQKFGIIRGLLQKGLRPCLDSALFVRANVASGDDDDRDHGESGDYLEPIHHDEAVASRQTEV